MRDFRREEARPEKGLSAYWVELAKYRFVGEEKITTSHVLWFMAGILSEPLKGIVKELGAVVVGVVEI